MSLALWIAVFLSFRLGALNARYRHVEWSTRSPPAFQLLILSSISLVVSLHAMYWRVWGFFTPAVVISAYFSVSMLTHFVPAKLARCG